MLARNTMVTIICIGISTMLYAKSKHNENEVRHGQETIHVSAEIIKRYNINLAKAGAQLIEVTRDVLGKIVPNANKTVYIYPRYAGIVKNMTKFLGDFVKNDELLATVESNQTLQTYDIKAPFSGFIIKKEVNPGEFVKTGAPIYQLADLSTVWLHLYIYRENTNVIRKGQTVMVQNNKKTETTKINYLSPLGIEHNQTMRARAVLKNDVNNLTWIPGLYINSRVVVDSKKVQVSVKNSAIQSFEGKKVVFIKSGDNFKPKVCKFGIKGETYTEVLSGLKAGDEYVAENSFLLKAELEKDSASHSH